MKILTLLLLSGGLALPVLFAGENAPTERPDPITYRVERMSENLDLSEAQKKQIEEILRTEQADRESIRARLEKAESPEERRALVQEVREERTPVMERIAAVLTEEQRDQMRVQRREAREQRREMRDRREEIRERREEMREKGETPRSAREPGNRGNRAGQPTEAGE